MSTSLNALSIQRQQNKLNAASICTIVIGVLWLLIVIVYSVSVIAGASLNPNTSTPWWMLLSGLLSLIPVGMGGYTSLRALVLPSIQPPEKKP